MEFIKAFSKAREQQRQLRLPGSGINWTDIDDLYQSKISVQEMMSDKWELQPRESMIKEQHLRSCLKFTLQNVIPHSKINSTIEEIVDSVYVKKMIDEPSVS